MCSLFVVCVVVLLVFAMLFSGVLFVVDVVPFVILFVSCVLVCCACLLCLFVVVLFCCLFVVAFFLVGGLGCVVYVC